METTKQQRNNAVTQKGPKNFYRSSDIRAAIRYILSQDTTQEKIEFTDSLRRQYNRIHSLSDRQTKILFEIYHELQ